MSSKTPVKCNICGQMVSPNSSTIVPEGNEIITVCPNCYSKVYSCHTCVNASICGFANDKSEPQIVQQTIRKGMMTVSQQIKNPNLVSKHCSTCICGDEENNCLKDFLGQQCIHWKLQTAVLR